MSSCIEVRIYRRHLICPKRKEKTYAIGVKYVWPNLVLHILFGGLLWVDLPVRRNEQVSRLFSLAVEMSDIEFEGADFRKLYGVNGHGIRNSERKW